MFGVAKVSKCDLSFTPGFSPVITGNKRRGTVLTVCSMAEKTKQLNTRALRQPADRETVEAVITD